MLAALVLAGVISAPIGTLGLLIPWRRPARTAGTWPAARRLVLAAGATVVLAAVVVGALRLLGDSQHLAIDAASGFLVASLVWLPVTRRWKARAHLCWSSAIFLFVVYLAFVFEWTLDSGLGLAGTIGGLVLWLLEVCASLLACAYLWEICDALGSEHWRRRYNRPAPGSVSDSELPFVSLHVPAHNEPPDMVLDTLRSLAQLDYPRYEIVVIDDNTDDEELWRPVEAWCERHGAKFAHLENWPGYKSGALNYALRELTDPRAEVIGVVDSDYQLRPGFLRRCAPLFADPWVGFTQAPQDYRGWSRSRYYRRLYYSYQYFFAVSQPSRNERDGAIFAGTMGLIRRVALEQLGGWDEWCITEDAELSLRLLRSGWSGLHVDESWGRGIMPLTFEALKGQRYRWCFRRYPDPAHALALPAAGQVGAAEPDERRPALGVPGRRRPVVRRLCSGCCSWCSSWPGPRIWRPAAASCSASSPCSWSQRCRCSCCSASSAPSRCCAAAPARPGEMPSAPSSSGNPRRWSWPARPSSPCSRRKRHSCARRRPASRPSGGKHSAPTGGNLSSRCSGSRGLRGH